MRRKLSGNVCLVTLAGLAIFLNAGFAGAASIAWTNVLGGLWSNPANWDLGRAPVAGDDVLIVAGGTYTVTLDTNGFANTVTVGGVSGTQTLDISPANTLGLQQPSAIGSNGVLSLSGQLDGAGAALTIQGTMNWMAGVLSNTPTVVPGGFLNVVGTNAKSLYFPITNNGTINWNGTGVMTGASSQSGLNNQAQLFVLTNINLSGFGTFSNGGTLSRPAQSGSATIISTWFFNNAGFLDAGTNASLVFMDSGTFTFRTTFESGTMITGAGSVGLVAGSAIADNLMTVNGTFDLNGDLKGTNVWTGSGNFNWRGGGFSTTGTTTFATNFHVNTLSGDGEVRYLSHHTLDNQGVVTHNDRHAILMNAATGGGGLWLNEGRLVLLTNCYFQEPAILVNTGSIECQIGTNTLQFLSSPFPPGFTNSGTFYAGSNANLRIDLGQTPASFLDGTAFSGPGVTTIQGAVSSLECDGSFAVNGNAELFGAIVTGTQTWNGPGQFLWTSGGFAGPGSTTFATNLNVLVANSGFAFIDNHTLNNQGTVFCDGRGIGFENNNGPVPPDCINNSGLFVLQGDCTFFSNLAVSNSINNLAGGTLRNISGNSVMRFAVTNAGILDLQQGTLQIQGPYVPLPGSSHHVAIGGAIAGTSYGQLNVGAFNPAGSIAVSLTNGFVPGNGSSFALVIYSSDAAQYASTQLPLLPPLACQLSYDPGALDLNVVSVPTRIGNAQVLSNGDFKFTLTGAPAVKYVIQASTNFTDWVPLLTNSPFNGSIDFTDSANTGFDKRFYRGLIGN